jgi:hypothetical protein
MAHAGDNGTTVLSLLWIYSIEPIPITQVLIAYIVVRQSMLKGCSALIALAIAMPLMASGPYSPVRVDLQRDEIYNTGKSLYWGAAKLGAGSSCSSCHTGATALSRARLAKMRLTLDGKVKNCITAPDRTNGSAEAGSVEALVHYLAKRFRL